MISYSVGGFRRQNNWTPCCSAFSSLAEMNIKQIRCSEKHFVLLTGINSSSCATLDVEFNDRSENGDVWTWGEGLCGALGHGDTSDRGTPTQVAALRNTKIMKVEAASGLSAAISGNTVYTLNPSRSSPPDDGRIFCWGFDSELFVPLCTPQPMERLRQEVAHIGIGGYRFVALTTKGSPRFLFIFHMLKMLQVRRLLGDPTIKGSWDSKEKSSQFLSQPQSFLFPLWELWSWRPRRRVRSSLLVSLSILIVHSILIKIVLQDQNKVFIWGACFGDTPVTEPTKADHQVFSSVVVL